MDHSTIFSQILEKVVQAVPGAMGAAFIDWEGEAVDSFCNTSTSEILLIAAHWGIIYYQIRRFLESVRSGEPKEVVLSFETQVVVIRRVTADYLVVISLAKGSNLGRTIGWLNWAEQKLREQM